MKLSNVIQFQIQKEDEGFSAYAVNLPIVTEAETLDELEKNIKEATELYFEDQSVENSVSKDASIFMNYEFPVYA